MAAWPNIKLIQLKKHISATCLPWLQCLARRCICWNAKYGNHLWIGLRHIKNQRHIWIIRTYLDMFDITRTALLPKNRYEMKPAGMRVSLDRDAPNHPSHETISVVNPWWLGYPHSGDQQILKFRHSTTGKLMVLGYFPGSQSTNPKTTVNHID